MRVRCVQCVYGVYRRVRCVQACTVITVRVGCARCVHGVCSVCTMRTVCMQLVYINSGGVGVCGALMVLLQRHSAETAFARRYVTMLLKARLKIKGT